MLLTSFAPSRRPFSLSHSLLTCMMGKGRESSITYIHSKYLTSTFTYLILSSHKPVMEMTWTPFYQIRFREIMRLAQYHTIGGSGRVVLRYFKKTCSKKAGWWTFSRCLLKSSAASIPETIPSQGCSWPMKGNNSGTRNGPFHPVKNSSDGHSTLGILLPRWAFPRAALKSEAHPPPSLFPSGSSFTGIRLASHSESLFHQICLLPLLYSLQLFPQINLSNI